MKKHLTQDQKIIKDCLTAAALWAAFILLLLSAASCYPQNRIVIKSKIVITTPIADTSRIESAWY